MRSAMPWASVTNALRTDVSPLFGSSVRTGGRSSTCPSASAEKPQGLCRTLTWSRSTASEISPDPSSRTTLMLSTTGMAGTTTSWPDSRASTTDPISRGLARAWESRWTTTLR
jgi:hypothetical protein